MKRMAAVAGQFYHGAADRLEAQVRDFLRVQGPRDEAVGIMVPHAGLVYSGAVAGAVFASIVPPDLYVMLGPNHTGLGAAAAVMEEGEWEVPTGTAVVDRRIAREMLRGSALLQGDSRAHMFEHSLEVQLPFILQQSPSARIVPISLMRASFDECMAIADAVAAAIERGGERAVILASSDMSHYISDRDARVKDRKALDRILALDPAGLYQTVKDERISMCGVLPATVMLAAARKLGARNARLVRYATSGETSGDYESVVGYAGVILTR